MIQFFSLKNCNEVQEFHKYWLLVQNHESYGLLLIFYFPALTKGSANGLQSVDIVDEFAANQYFSRFSKLAYAR